MIIFIIIHNFDLIISKQKCKNQITLFIGRSKWGLYFKTRFVDLHIIIANNLFSPRLTSFDLLLSPRVLNLSCSIVVKSLDVLYLGLVVSKGMKILKFLKFLKIGCDENSHSSWWILKFNQAPTVLATVYSDPSFYNMMKIPSLSTGSGQAPNHLKNFGISLRNFTLKKLE